ncbi:UNVERIFIED_CONTAM: hypothetical protein FKN15_063389 [Acipenser sinensis]
MGGVKVNAGARDVTDYLGSSLNAAIESRDHIKRRRYSACSRVNRGSDWFHQEQVSKRAAE